MNCLQEIREMSDQIIQWRRELHKTPELDNYLPKTKEYVVSQLKAMNVEYTEYEDQSGITVVIGKPGNKVVALRADMDGLPVKEATGLDFASENGCMHACGHDGHTAMLLGAVKYFKNHEDELNGQVKFIFQPGEENLFGAAAMIKDGVLENPSVDRLYSLHIGTISGNAGTGHLIVHKRHAFIASENVDIIVHGKGGHGASPHITVDSVAIAAEIVVALQMIVSRELKPGEMGIISLSAIHSSSSIHNVISENCKIYANIRAKNPETQKFLLKRAEEMARGIAEAHGASLTFKSQSGAPPTVNEPEVAEDLIRSAEKVLDKSEIHVKEEVNLGAEDCAFYFEKVPGCYFFMSTPKEASDGIVYPHHNEKFDIDESVLYKGAAVMAQAALDYINE